MLTLPTRGNVTEGRSLTRAGWGRAGPGRPSIARVQERGRAAQRGAKPWWRRSVLGYFRYAPLARTLGGAESELQHQEHTEETGSQEYSLAPSPSYNTLTPTLGGAILAWRAGRLG